jgi:hypothetical protein
MVSAHRNPYLILTGFILLAGGILFIWYQTLLPKVRLDVEATSREWYEPILGDYHVIRKTYVRMTVHNDDSRTIHLYTIKPAGLISSGKIYSFNGPIDYMGPATQAIPPHESITVGEGGADFLTSDDKNHTGETISLGLDFYPYPAEGNWKWLRWGLFKKTAWTPSFRSETPQQIKIVKRDETNRQPGWQP